MATRKRAPPYQGWARVGYVYAAPLVCEEDHQRRKPMPILNTNKEREIILDKIRCAGRQIVFRATVATPSNMRGLVTDGCQMLHYAGHGNEALLSFESDLDTSCGTMEPLRVDKLKKLFRAGGVSTELVYISSCSSEPSGKAFEEAGVPHVVAVKMQGIITDEAAHTFCGAFYHALFTKGKSVQNAFDIAVSTVNLSSHQEQGDNFLLLPRGGHHDVRLFDTLPEGSFYDETAPLPPDFCLPRARSYCLGTLGLQRIVKNLVDPNATCVTVTGEPGSGKTEMALQASKYLQERHRFGAIFFADCSAAVMAAASSAHPLLGRSVSASFADDLCGLIGRAIGMPNPGPLPHNELKSYLFTRPMATTRGRPPEKVLLILDAVDALYENAGSETRECLVGLLNDLCRFGEGQLRFLLTSENTLLSGASTFFHNGSEKESRVAALKGTDPARLLVDSMPRCINYVEDLESRPKDSKFASILESLQTHSVLKAARGHPGTLVRLASRLNDKYLSNPDIQEKASSFRKEYDQPSHMRRRCSRANSNASSIASIANNSTHNGSTHHQVNLSPTRRHCYDNSNISPAGDMLLISHAPSFASSTNNSSNHGQYPPRLQHQMRQSQDQQAMAQNELESESPSPMSVEERHAWDVAKEAGLRDRGCRLVWVMATMIAATSRRCNANREHPYLVPWSSLAIGLQKNLCGSLAIPSRCNQVVGGGPFGCRGASEGVGEWTESLADERGDYGCMGDMQEPRGMNPDELKYVRGMLQKAQKLYGGDRGWGQGHAGGDSVGEHGGLDGADRNFDRDVVSVEAFKIFCERWWAPLMTTLSQVKEDWVKVNPAVIIMGFVGKIEAENKLLTLNRGTFLLRFSESAPGRLVVSYTASRCEAPSVATSATTAPSHVVHVLIDVCPGGRCCILANGHRQLKYASLHDLILECGNIRTLYPDIPKEQVFVRGPRPSAASAYGEQEELDSSQE